MSNFLFRFDGIPHRKKKNRTASHKVLKRNRTLKVLNLSENKLDVQRLIVIAEALVRLRFRSFAFFFADHVWCRNTIHVWKRWI